MQELQYGSKTIVAERRGESELWIQLDVLHYYVSHIREVRSPPGVRGGGGMRGMPPPEGRTYTLRIEKYESPRGQNINAESRAPGIVRSSSCDPRTSDESPTLDMDGPLDTSDEMGDEVGVKQQNAGVLLSRGRRPQSGLLWREIFTYSGAPKTQVELLRQAYNDINSKRDASREIFDEFAGL